MAKTALIDRALTLLRELRTANGANVTVTFALAVIPMVGAVGAAVDYSRANSVKTAMQAAADSTALMLSKEVASLNENQVQAKASSYFNALFTHPEAKSLNLAATYTVADGSMVKVNATSDVPTSFMGVMGIKFINVGVESQVKWGNTKLRVSLALDVTGSMSSAGKMNALKTATNNLLNQLKSAAAKDGDVYVSIIPFSKDVNLYTSNFNASWINWEEWEDEPPFIKNNKPSDWEQIGPGSTCPFTTSSHGFRCMTTPTGTTAASNIPSSGSYAGYICPGQDNGSKIARQSGRRYNGCYDSVEATKTVGTGNSASCGTLPNCTCSGNGSKKVCTQTYYTHTWIKNARSTWNGCVSDRGDTAAPNSGNFDTNVAAPTSSNKATQYTAEQYGSCSAQASGLSYNWSAMTSMVNNLTPTGMTNQGLGLQVGWMSLVGGGPFTVPPMDPNFKYSQVVILMTDGLNTQNRWYNSQSSIDARQQLTCNNAKAAGITLYTVQVNTDKDPVSTLLQNCASTPDKFFYMTSAQQLVSAFEQIGTALSNLRVSK
jgi:Flp pilus assembly protein TadG